MSTTEGVGGLEVCGCEGVHVSGCKVGSAVSHLPSPRDMGVCGTSAGVTV